MRGGQWALADPQISRAVSAKVATLLGSECLWGIIAVSGRTEREHITDDGHG